MDEPLVTVTMPCRDCEETVTRAMESVLGQTLGEIEVVAVNDGSRDATGAILDEFARRDKRVRAVHSAHGGVAVAANTAIRLARGQYIARMDADDEMLPDRLAAQARLLDDNPAVGLAGCRIRFGGNRRRSAGYARYVDWTNTLLTHEAISLNRFVEFPVPNPSIMCRRQCLEDHGSYRDGDFPEDYDLLLRWLDAGVRTAKVDAELMVWNDPPERLSRTHPRYRVEAFYRLKADYLARWLARHNPHHPEVHILGSGRTTRKRADMLREHGIRFAAYYDVDPRKIGQVVEGLKVRPRDAVPPPGSAFCLSYVASRGAREDIAAFLRTRGHLLGRDYLPVA